jgi:hypothetical protein
MSVQLSDAIGKLETQRQFSAFLRRDIDHTVSWSGKREVSIEGYTGSIEVHTLIRKFLHCASLTSMPETLRERLEWYDVYSGIEEVCRKSDEAWKKTFIQYVIFEGSMQDSMDCIRQSENFKNQFLTFSKRTFICLWPDKAKIVNGYPDNGLLIVPRDFLAEVVEELEGKKRDKEL